MFVALIFPKCQMWLIPLFHCIFKYRKDLLKYHLKRCSGLLITVAYKHRGQLLLCSLEGTVPPTLEMTGLSGNAHGAFPDSLAKSLHSEVSQIYQAKAPGTPTRQATLSLDFHTPGSVNLTEQKTRCRQLYG